jgi:hypothetical protein
MTVTKSKTNRKRLLRAGGMLMMVIALFVCQFSVPAGSAQTIGVEFIFDIVPDTSTLTNLPSTGILPGQGTTFYIQGKIFPFRTVNAADCTFRTTTPRQLGTWRAWGTVADNGRVVVNQSLTLDYINGAIELQGTTGIVLSNGPAFPAIAGTRGEPFTGPTEVLSVTGGAGAYRGLSGEAQNRPYCQSQADTLRPFRYDRAFCLQIVEGKRIR